MATASPALAQPPLPDLCCPPYRDVQLNKANFDAFSDAAVETEQLRLVLQEHTQCKLLADECLFLRLWTLLLGQRHSC